MSANFRIGLSSLVLSEERVVCRLWRFGRREREEGLQD